MVCHFSIQIKLRVSALPHIGESQPAAQDHPTASLILVLAKIEQPRSELLQIRGVGHLSCPGGNFQSFRI